MTEQLARLQVAFTGRYAIERALGAGGMATVYLARDVKHDREVALKVLRPELAAVLGTERFLQEIRISAKLDHPHILTLIDSGESDGFVWYVLPYVRGESLRDKLAREQQLGLEEALAITKQIAGALEYAHRHGVVHRDIKPENILLHEGEAMLADFGIALAVKQAGADRLTESGLSLGTPQYMSPEQATGERQLDARSDVYSLAAVLYEMLAGEPPVTGPSAQAMIAKLLTERPTRLRVVRDTVPEGVDAAVARALAKTPADRFATTGDFARALEAGFAASPAARRGLRGLPLAATLTIVAVAAVLAILGALGKLGQPGGRRVVLTDKTQLTQSGNVRAPAISPDGKQLAYVTQHCTTGGCTYSVVVQDVGGTVTRSILDGATDGLGIVWSPDRRNLLFVGTINRRYGVFLLSTLGGAPRLLGSGFAAFFAGGDSLLIGAPGHQDSVFWIRVATLDGVVHDSIPVRSPGWGVGFAVVPGSAWIATSVTQGQHGLVQIIDRHGTVADRQSCNCFVELASGDALWLSGDAGASGSSVVRIGIDPASGHLAARQDTISSGHFTNFSVTADGARFVMDEGTYEYSAWALDFVDALRGRFPDSRRVARASASVVATVSPDGARLLISRTVPTSAGHSEERLAVMPFAGGQETAVRTTGVVQSADWTDSVTLAIATLTSRGLHFAQVDIRTSAELSGLDLPDSSVYDLRVVPGGWAWIPLPGDRIVIQQGGRRREILKPTWFSLFGQVAPDPSGHDLGYSAWNVTYDTIAVGVISLDDGSMTPWGAALAAGGAIKLLGGGTMLFLVSETKETATFYRLRSPGRMERIGTVPRPVTNIWVSNDLKRATVQVRDYHADAWMSQVLRR